MPKHTLLLVLVGLSITLASCKALRYYKPRNHVVNTAYLRTDTMIISQVALCNTLINEFRYNHPEPFDSEFNSDSIFHVFLSSLERLRLPVKLDDIHYICDSTFTQLWRLDPDRIVPELDKFRSKDEQTIQLIPVLHVAHGYRKHIYMSQGLAGGGHYIKQALPKILIYVIRGEEILYLRTAQFFGPTYHSYDERETRTDLEQEHWDRLVELVFRDMKVRMR
jgi:hypothetical protein